MSITYIKGDLLTFNGLIVHQTNCTTRGSRGLATYIFDKIPEANVYTPEYDRKPGTIIVKKNVVALFGQRLPNKPSKYESYEQRKVWFQSGLNELTKYMHDNNINEVAFPYLIGCGLAGGIWSEYENMIEKFAIESNFSVKIYQLE